MQITFSSSQGLFKIEASTAGIFSIAPAEVAPGNAVFSLEHSTNNQSEIFTAKILQQACQELEEYFSGKRQSFSIPLAPVFYSDFQQKILEALQKIPYGTTATYGELATLAGYPRAARATGQALNRNPLMIVLPCHRIVAANGKPGGYAWGNDWKRRLLALEGVILP